MTFKLFELYFLDFFAFTQKYRTFVRYFCCASFLSTHFGPSSATRTHDLHIPNVARYQLRYTRKSRGCRQPSGSSCSPLYIIFPRMSNVLVSAVCAEAQRHMKGRLTVSAGPPRSSRYPDWGKTGSPRGRADIQWEEPPAEFLRPDFLPLAAISPL